MKLFLLLCLFFFSFQPCLGQAVDHRVGGCDQACRFGKERLRECCTRWFRKESLGYCQGKKNDKAWCSKYEF